MQEHGFGIFEHSLLSYTDFVSVFYFADFMTSSILPLYDYLTRGFSVKYIEKPKLEELAFHSDGIIGQIVVVLVFV